MYVLGSVCLVSLELLSSPGPIPKETDHVATLGLIQ